MVYELDSKLYYFHHISTHRIILEITEPNFNEINK